MSAKPSYRFAISVKLLAQKNTPVDRRKDRDQTGAGRSGWKLVPDERPRSGPIASPTSMLLEVMVQGVSALSRTTRRNSDILNARSKLKPAQTLQRLYACRKISSDAILKCQPFLLRTNRGLMASMKFHVHQCTVLSNSETIHKATVIGLLSSMKRFISWIRLLHGIVGHVAKCLFSRVNASSQRCSWSPDPMAWSRNNGE